MKQLEEEFDFVAKENDELIELQSGNLVQEPKGKLLHIKKGRRFQIHPCTVIPICGYKTYINAY